MAGIIAECINTKDTTYMIARGLGSPVGKKDRDKCGVLPEYIQGSVCYRICGEIPAGRKPARVEFLTRPSYQGEDTPWQTCDSDGCDGVNYDFDRMSSKVCGLFKLWRGDGSHRDLMMKVTLS